MDLEEVKKLLGQLDSQEATDDITEPRLREVVERVLRYYMLVMLTTELPPALAVTMAERDEQAGIRMRMLKELERARWALLVADDRPPALLYPETFLIAQLRVLQTSWRDIGDAVKMTKAGAFKKYGEEVDRILFEMKKAENAD